MTPADRYAACYTAYQASVAATRLASIAQAANPDSAALRRAYAAAYDATGKLLSAVRDARAELEAIQGKEA